MIRFVLLGVLLCAASLSAATVTVMNTNDAGSGSLRDAVSSASSGDTILFDSSLAGSTITLTSGEIAIGSKELTITGLTGSNGKPNLTISGNDASRIFDTSVALTLSDLHLLDGNSGSSNGGAVHNSNSTIDCRNCVFESNRTTGAEGGALAGDVTTLIDCSFIDNSTPSGWVGGAINLTGGSNKTYLRCTFSGNAAAGGGAFYVSGSSSIIIKVINCTFSSNQALSTSAFGGGAIAIYSLSGGAISVTSIHCTFSNNTSARAAGGQCFWIHATSTTASSTVIFAADSSIFTDSSASAMFAKDGGGGVETYTSLGFNVCSDAPTWMTGSFDQPNTDPMLANLADNGGLTMTHAITAASPALDAGDPFGSSATVVTDQRGYVRDGNPDAGSFEFGAVVPGSGSTSGSGGNDSKCSTDEQSGGAWLLALAAVAALAGVRVVRRRV